MTQHKTPSTLLIGFGLFLLAGCSSPESSSPIITRTIPAINSIYTPPPVIGQSLTETPTKILQNITVTPTLYPLGNGELIAFNSQIINEDQFDVQESFISVIDLNNNGILQLTPKDIIARFAKWSPDGRRIAYNVPTSQGNSILYIMDANGENKVSVKSDCDNAEWSPNGELIACISSSDYSGYAIYIIDVNKKHAQKAVERTYAHVSWSPDSQSIIYNSGMPGDDISNIYLLNIEGNMDPVQLTSDQNRDSEPEWSPDGNQILFSSTRTGVKQIYLMNADGTHEYALTDGDKPNFGAKWSPDGTKIIFVSLRHENNLSRCAPYINPCNSEIYLMNADGSKQIRLTDSLGEDSSPVWSPDGKSIAFMSFRDEPNFQKCLNCNSEIYIMNIDNMKAKRLTNNQTYDFRPVWQPKP